MIGIKLIAASVLGLGLLGGVTGYGPKAVDLVPGQVYRTGSPLSQPGIIGLFGGILGTHTGGGYERYTGEYVPASAGDAYNVRGGWEPATAADYVNQTSPGLTLEEVKDRQDQIDWSQVPNRKRAEDAPDCDGGQLWITYVPDPEIGAHVEWRCEHGTSD